MLEREIKALRRQKADRLAIEGKQREKDVNSRG